MNCRIFAKNLRKHGSRYDNQEKIALYNFCWSELNDLRQS